MDRKDDFRNFCRAVERIFLKMGGYKKSTATLKLFFYAAFSNYSILKKTDIPTIRTFKNNLIDLLELSEKSLEKGILAIANDREAFSERNGLPVQTFYFDHSDKDTAPWEYFPRYVTKSEFLKPADCVHSVFAHKSLLDWKMIMEELFSSALLHQSIFEFSSMMDNAIEIHDDMFKLLEITHLIKIRRPFLTS